MRVYGAVKASEDAIPVLFPPVHINNQRFIDGGTVTSKPTCIAYMLACQIFTRVDRIWVLSIGTNNTPSEEDDRFSNNEMGIIQLLSMGLPMKILNQGSSMVNTLVESLLGERYFRIDTQIDGSIDDVNIHEACIRASEHKWEGTKVILEKWLRMSKSIDE